MGYFVLAGLTLLNAAAAFALCVRARFDHRAEQLVAWGTALHTLVLLPIYGLAFAHRLTAWNLGLTSLLTALAVLFATMRGGGSPGVHAREVGRAGLRLLRAPLDALEEAARARSLVVIGLVASMALIAWTALTTYFAPAWRGWDALWYHEPIVGLTLQNHGFGYQPLPPGMQNAAAYPRVVEMTDLWCVIFTDRRLIELPSCFAAPLFMASVYALAHRFQRDRVQCMGFACAAVLLPCCANLLQSTYVDVSVAFFLLAATHFATRPYFRARDALFFSAAVALLLGSKLLALAPAPVLLAIGLARLVQREQRRPRVLVGTLVGGISLIVALGASIYLRNWVVFKNPLWPEFNYDNARLGIHWVGNLTLDTSPPGTSSLNMNEPFGQLRDDLLSAPYSWSRWHYGEVHDYGFAIGWVVAPLAVAAFLGLLVLIARDQLRPLVGRRSWRASADTRNVFWVFSPALAILWLSPALWASRYHIGTVGLFYVLLAWLAGRPGWQRLGEGVVAIGILSGIATIFWGPRFLLTPSELSTLAHMPYPEREFAPSPSFTTAPVSVGASVTTEAGLARERELGAGKVLAFPDNNGVYAALLWNNEFSNRIEWVPNGPDLLARVQALAPTWIYASYSDPLYLQLAAPTSGWEVVAPLNVERWGAVFRHAARRAAR